MGPCMYVTLNPVTEKLMVEVGGLQLAIQSTVCTLIYLPAITTL